MAPYEMEAVQLDHIGQNGGTLNKGNLICRINEAIARVCRDIHERPDVTKPRGVSVTIEFCPDDSGNVEIKSRVQHKVPAAKVLTSRGVVRNGQVMVNVFFAEPDQIPLPNVLNLKAAE